MSWEPRVRPDHLRVAVLAGGASAEREISLATGANVQSAFASSGHTAILVDPAQQDLAQISWSQFDGCFVALHGGAGEDGRIQRRLDLLRVPYTGSGPDASRLAMSKSASKERFRQAGVATADYVLFEAHADPADLLDRFAHLGLPLVVKPDSQGSSLGVSVVRQPSELAGAIAQAARYDEYLLAESLVRGREFTVTVIERETLPIIEVVTPRGLFDYHAKYTADDTVYRCNPRMSPFARRQIEQTALSAAAALGTRGLARVDLILDRPGRAWVLEVNTIPGMTSHSLAPKAAAHAGISMPELCERLMRNCLVAESAR